MVVCQPHIQQTVLRLGQTEFSECASSPHPIMIDMLVARPVISP